MGTVFANSADLDEIVHDELSPVDVLCLPSSLRIFNMLQFEQIL